MGSWNKTCGLSNLHIHAGEKAYVFVLEEREKKYHDRCYATAYWQPLLMPFVTTYNDYGGGEESTGVSFLPTMEAIKSQLLEMDLGENQYHDIAVRKDTFDEELFFEAVHENRLFTKGYGGKSTIDYVMFRKDVVDHILENYVQEDYVGDGKGTSGYGNSYNKYRFADLVAGIDPFLDLMASKLTEVSVDDELPGMDRYRFVYRGIDGLVEYKDRSITMKYLSGDGHRYCRLLAPYEMIAETMMAGDRALAHELTQCALLGKFLDSFMEETRKMWIPAGHEGSQGQDHGGYRALMSAMDHALKAEKAKWDEDEDYDDDADVVADDAVILHADLTHEDGDIDEALVTR